MTQIFVFRSDLLCLEGIARSLRIFTGAEETPKYKLSDISSKSMITMHVKPEVVMASLILTCSYVSLLRDSIFKR